MQSSSIMASPSLASCLGSRQADSHYQTRCLHVLRWSRANRGNLHACVYDQVSERVSRHTTHTHTQIQTHGVGGKEPHVSIYPTTYIDFYNGLQLLVLHVTTNWFLRLMPYRAFQCMQHCTKDTRTDTHTHMQIVTNATAVFTQSSEGEMPATIYLSLPIWLCHIPYTNSHLKLFTYTQTFVYLYTNICLPTHKHLCMNRRAKLALGSTVM